MHLVLAQLHVELEQWELAGLHLEEGVNGFRNDVLRSRATFLRGQILERLDLPEEAIVAYSHVSRRYPEYQLLFLAELRQNQLTRAIGNYDRAHRNFVSMSRDDKNFDNLSILEFEIGRTLQARGQADEAFLVFNNVLYNSLQAPSRETIAKAHYAKAELYRFIYGDFRMAALYYDSSSRSATDLTRMPEKFDAAELASSFGDYARLSEAISRRDSLMHLGSLPPEEFQDRILAIRDERLREFERQQRQDQLRGTTVVTITEQPVQQNQDQTRDNGFLNHRNPQMLTQASESFLALWNGRPLVDDWRRQEAVRVAIIAMESGEMAEEIPQDEIGLPSAIANVDIPAELEINLQEIPRTEADRRRIRGEIARFEYELGNVFYLNLNLPDSALVHYLRVAEEFLDADIRPQAMYSIADIYLLYNNMETAMEWAMAIIEEFPASLVAERIASRMNLDVDLAGGVLSDEEVAESEFVSLLQQMTTFDAGTRISQFDEFTKRHPYSGRIADALFSKALAYAEVGRAQRSFIERFDERERLRNEWSEHQEQFRIQQDSARVALQDTTLSDDRQLYFESVVDSTLVQPDFDALFPFVGSPWDSTRVTLTKISEEFSATRFAERSRAMLDVIQLPASLLPKEEQSEESASVPEDLPADFIAEFVECNVLDGPIRFFKTNEDFLQSTGFYAMMREQGVLSADFEFDVTVDHTGQITRVVSLIEEDPLGLSTSLRNLLQTEGSFSRPTSRDMPVQTTCYFSISVDL
jgi:tetratricopeptide (TPR) repeat protein